MIGIIDYGVGNIKAFANIYKSFDIPFKTIKTVDDFEDVTKLILPGVGSFDHAMSSLQSSGMREKLDELVLEKKLPVIGICVGMQMLAKSSEEGVLSGLGWINGVVKKFDKSRILNGPLPHMGWNTLSDLKSGLFSDQLANKFVYFVHSYYVPVNEHTVATTNYILPFSAAMQKDNFFATQFHPEKSGTVGELILQNFINL